jgi:hypothetical protein
VTPPRWWISLHALDRWQERFRPDLSRDDAGNLLRTLSANAVDAGEAPRGGHRVELHPELPEVRFVVSRDVSETGLRTLVTVLDREITAGRWAKPDALVGRSRARQRRGVDG